MDYNTVIVDTDARQHQLADSLQGIASTNSIVDLLWNRERLKCEQVIENANAIVLPTPAQKMQAYPLLNDKLKQELIKTSKKRLLFGGKLSPWEGSIGEKFLSGGKETGIDRYDFLESEGVVLKNAQITAEATIGLLIMHTKVMLQESRVAITGYGRCGREVARLLKNMGAQTLVLARKEQSQRMAKAEGHEIGWLPFVGFEKPVDAIINTVPARVVDRSMLWECRKDTLVIDIASAPGGVDLIAATARGIKVVSALGLPGRYLTQSGARAFASYLYEIQQKTPFYINRNKEQTWIYRITP